MELGKSKKVVSPSGAGEKTIIIVVAGLYEETRLINQQEVEGCWARSVGCLQILAICSWILRGRRDWWYLEEGDSVISAYLLANITSPTIYMVESKELGCRRSHNNSSFLLL